MDNKLEEAIELLKKNNYVVIQISDNMRKYFNECVRINGGTCAECPCNICSLSFKQYKSKKYR